MKHRKYLLKTCVLLFIFVCAATAPHAFADGPPESQGFGIGFSTMHSDGGFLGLNVRSWTENMWGWEVGYATRGESLSGHGGSYSWRYHVIPVSALYTLTHVDTDSVYVRPYAGGGINIARFSTSYDSSLNITGAQLSSTKAGGQGFVGAELTFKGFPRLGVSADLGYSHIGGGGNFGFNLKAHYYLK